MNIQRFIAPTAREALYKARMAFGEGTLILSNRPTASGIEVVATGEDTLAALQRNDEPTGQRRPAAPLLTAQRANPDSQVLDDATQLAMSTLSFQDYVRERMLKRRQENQLQQRSDAAAPPSPPSSAQQPRPLVPQAPARAAAASASRVATPTPTPVMLRPAQRLTPVAAPVSSPNIVNELQAMKDMIEDRFNTLTCLGQARQSPIHAQVMLKLIRCGYSPSLSRTIMERMPEDIAPTEAVRWIMDVLTHNLHTDAEAVPIEQEGGVYALVGATGVGKTTTAAKLAGLCARAHGAASVGLITLDTYRVGAHEQLRAFGRMLGVVAHQAQDRVALQDLLGLLANKKMVLIDTTGVSPNDARKNDLLAMLDIAGVNRLMVLNAGGHGDTLEDMVLSFKKGSVQQTVLSKTDEAAKIGPALDTVVRHQLKLRGVTTGQKVPQDWARADAANLVAMSMRSANKSAFDPKSSDLGFIFAQATSLPMGQLHA